MKCPYCEYLESKVIDTRPVEDGSSIRRRRECLKCEKRFTTYEVVGDGSGQEYREACDICGANG